MECNRHEAHRAVEVAERKFLLQDYVTAKKLLLKAQQLYPSLDKISHMSAVVEVHMVAQAKAPGGDIDCYQLLQVDTSADYSAIKKNYRRLALLLHPDKNKSPGAETAFKLIGEAWGVLSDKTKRSIYDWEISMKHFKVTKVPNLHTENGHSNQHKTQASNRAANFSENSHVGKFWTACPHCKMHYECFRIYINFKLKCQKCLKNFVAKAPLNGTKEPFGWPNFHGAKNTDQPQGFMFNQNLNNGFEGSRFSGSGAVPAAAGAAVPNPAVGRDTINKVHQSPAGMKNAHKDSEEVKKAHASAVRVKPAEIFSKDVDRDSAALRCSKQALDRETKTPKEEKADAMAKSRKQEAIDASSMKRKKKHEEAAARLKVDEPCSRKRLKKAAPRDEDEVYGRGKGFEGELQKLNTMVPDSHERPLDAAIDSKVRRSSRTKKNVNYNFDHSEDEDDYLVAFPRSRRRGKIDVGVTADLQKDDTAPSVVQLNGQTDSDGEPEGGVPDSGDELDVYNPQEIPVPDPDFYNFDEDRTEKSFSVGQIWAVYDDFDGMPRYYCRIMKVPRGDGFLVCTKWLEPLPGFSGIIQGLSASCGEFVYGKQQITKSGINQFSHVMRVGMADKNLVKIYPRSGEVWALYKDWGITEFMSSTADQVKNWNYEIVEVITGFSEETGVDFTPLVKVDGYKTVFTRQVNYGLLKKKWLSSNELSRFSHMVPSWKIIGVKEALGTLKDSWDLDPASLPLALIHGPAYCNVSR